MRRPLGRWGVRVKGKGKTEVAEKNVCLVVPSPEHDVWRLDVAVDDALRVDILKDIELAQHRISAELIPVTLIT